MTPCAYYIRLLVYHSIFRKNLLLPCYHVLNTLLPCLPLPCLISSITLLPCLLLLCYHVLNILLPCLEYPVTMSLITLSHVFHYSVTMSLITLSHAFHYPVSIKECKTTKKSWQINYPKEPYPSKQLTCQLVYLFTRLLKKTRLLKISQTFHYLFFMNAAGLALVLKGCKSATGWSRNRGPLRYNWLPCWLYL